MTNYVDTAFKVLSFSPGPFWIAILFFPSSRWAMRAVDVFLFLLSAHFAWLTLPAVPTLLPLIAEPTFPQIQAFISSPLGTLGSWNHMILADLWIGRWIAYDSKKWRYPLIVRLCFIPWVLFFGPLGLFLYLVTRALVQRRFWLEG